MLSMSSSQLSRSIGPICERSERPLGNVSLDGARYPPLYLFRYLGVDRSRRFIRRPSCRAQGVLGVTDDLNKGR